MPLDTILIALSSFFLKHLNLTKQNFYSTKEKFKKPIKGTRRKQTSCEESTMYFMLMKYK
jgi:hypothetical protein